MASMKHEKWGIEKYISCHLQERIYLCMDEVHGNRFDVVHNRSKMACFVQNPTRKFDMPFMCSFLAIIAKYGHPVNQ